MLKMLSGYGNTSVSNNSSSLASSLAAEQHRLGKIFIIYAKKLCLLNKGYFLLLYIEFHFVYLFIHWISDLDVTVCCVGLLKNNVN